MTANNATIKSSSALSPGDEAPELTTLDLSKGWFERGGKRIGKAAGKAVFRAHLGKRQVNMYLDAAVIEYFKAKAGGRGYQALINEALREAIDRESIETMLRHVMREELQRAHR